MKIGIFGGTFDPMTLAHREIIEKSLEYVDKVVVLPSIVTYHRKNYKPMFTDQERIQIIDKMVEDLDNVIVDESEYEVAKSGDALDIEARRYTDMLYDAMNRYGWNNEYYTIIGGDEYSIFNTWHDYKLILDYSKLIVAYRDSRVDPNFKYDIPIYALFELSESVRDLSATAVRNRLELNFAKEPFGSQRALIAYIKEIDDYLKAKKNYKENKEMTKETPFNDKTKLLETPIFSVFKEKEVEPGFRPVTVKAPDWISIIVHKDGKFLMERQKRFGTDCDVVEFPCGMVEEGEDAIVAAQRELLEETGYDVKLEDIQPIGKYASNPAFMTNYMHYFYVNLDAIDPIENVGQDLDEHEHIEVFWMDKYDVETLTHDNVQKACPALLGCALWALNDAGVL